MTINKRRKSSRHRGKSSHGWGHKKKHRGAGHRGGRGNAGTGKRGDAKKPAIWKNKRYFGKRGFANNNIKTRISAISIKTIEDMLGTLIKKGAAAEKDGAFEIDIKKIGYNKLLGTGKVTKRLKIKAPYASSKAVEKIKEKGGDVLRLVEQEKEEKCPEPQTKEAEKTADTNKADKGNTETAEKGKSEKEA